MAKTEIVGMKELEKMMRKLEKVPQKVVTKAAKQGANIAFKAAKANAPVDEGDLKGALILKGEKRTQPGKKVYDVMIDPSKSDLFVGISAEGERSFYPASQEYGYMTVDGRFIPGYHYLRDALVDNASAIERKVIEVAGNEVGKIIGSGN